MEHNLLFPLLHVLGQERRTDPDDFSAANIVAARLLRSPYLGRAYASHHLAQIAPGEWRLFQWDRGEPIARDPLITFHDDYYGEEEEEGRWFRITGRPQTIKTPVAVEGEAGIAPHLIERADALLERVRQHAPDAIAKLLEPTPEQMEARRNVVVEEVSTDQLGNHLRAFLGDSFDGSLKSYGIDYHSWEHFTSKSIYLVARSGDELAGVMKLGANKEWAYVLSYVSVSPGFREQGLSKRLYARALELCERDGRVFMRSQPGDFTLENPDITIAYDRMVKESPVLHVDSESPLLYPIEKAVEMGLDHAQMRERFKAYCDAAVPTPHQRREGLPSWQKREEERAWAATLADELQRSSAPRRRGP